MNIEDHEIQNRFCYHKPSPEQVVVYEKLRNGALVLARLYAELLPDCREAATALTRLEEAAMHANAAVARRT